MRPLGYELTGRGLQSPRGSQTRRSGSIGRPSHCAASHTISPVAPRFVHNSVHTPRRPITPTRTAHGDVMRCCIGP
jgi:hypothetical protein